MAADTDLDIGQIRNLPAGQVKTRPDLFQYRDVSPGLDYDEEKAADIAKNFDADKLDPLTVVANPEEPGSYVVIAGHHRRAALAKMGKKKIPVRIVRGDLSDPADRKRLKDNAILSNYTQGQSSPLETARSLRALAEGGPLRPAAERMTSLSSANRLQVVRLAILPDSIIAQSQQRPELLVAAEQLGWAVDKYQWPPDAALGLWAVWMDFNDRKRRLPNPAALRVVLESVQKRRRRRQKEADGTAEGQFGFDFGDAETSAIVTALQAAIKGGEQQQLELKQLRRQSRDCLALGKQLRVKGTMKPFSKAAQARIRDLSAKQAEQAQRIAAAYREQVGGEGPAATEKAAPPPRRRPAAAGKERAGRGGGKLPSITIGR